MFGWVCVAVAASPLLFMAGRELADEVAFAVFLRRHCERRPARGPLVASLRPTPLEVAGFAGMVVEGEVVEVQA